MTSINSFKDTSGMQALSTTNLIKNLIHLLAFKYEILGMQHQLGQEDKIRNKIEL
jgi:hypothetical protein